jgi:hypothetical protein
MRSSRTAKLSRRGGNHGGSSTQSELSIPPAKTLQSRVDAAVMPHAAGSDPQDVSASGVIARNSPHPLRCTNAMLCGLRLSNSDAASGRNIVSVTQAARDWVSKNFNIEYEVPEVRTAVDIETTISSMGPEDGMVVAADPFLWANHRLIIDLAARYRVPTIYAWSGYG